MALSKDKKSQVVEQVSDLLDNSKLTVLAKYPGTSVKSMQALRKSAKENGTVVKVIKNRLFLKAMEKSSRFEDVDKSAFAGQLMYAFNAEDELAPAQTLANFAKQEPQIEFVGALNDTGEFINADDVKALASLPGKQELRAQLAGTISAPLTGMVRVISGNLRELVNVLNARSESI